MKFVIITIKIAVNKDKKNGLTAKERIRLIFPSPLEKEIPTQVRHRIIAHRQNDFSDGKNKTKQAALALKLHKFPRSNCQSAC